MRSVALLALPALAAAAALPDLGNGVSSVTPDPTQVHINGVSLLITIIFDSNTDWPTRSPTAVQDAHKGLLRLPSLRTRPP